MDTRKRLLQGLKNHCFNSSKLSKPISKNIYIQTKLMLELDNDRVGTIVG